MASANNELEPLYNTGKYMNKKGATMKDGIKFIAKRGRKNVWYKGVHQIVE